jgi:hypothetical protein
MAPNFVLVISHHSIRCLGHCLILDEDEKSGEEVKVIPSQQHPGYLLSFHVPPT